MINYVVFGLDNFYVELKESGAVHIKLGESTWYGSVEHFKANRVQEYFDFADWLKNMGKSDLALTTEEFGELVALIIMVYSSYEKINSTIA